MMAQNRPDKPSVTLPDDFGGTKTAFDDELVENGYEASTPEVLEGGNLNYMLDGLFQNTKYMRAVLDYVRDTPIGKMFWVNSNGQMDYIQPSVIATDEEFTTGTATDKTPNVKQVVDEFALKVNTTAMESYVQTYVTNTINTLLTTKLFPVGSFYLTKTNTNPNTILGFGTWTSRGTTLVTTLASSATVYGTANTCMRLAFKGTGDSPVASDGTYNMISSKYTHDSNIDGLTLGDSSFARVRGQGKVNIASSGTTNVYASTGGIATKITVYTWERTA